MSLFRSSEVQNYRRERDASFFVYCLSQVSSSHKSSQIQKEIKNLFGKERYTKSYHEEDECHGKGKWYEVLSQLASSRSFFPRLLLLSSLFCVLFILVILVRKSRSTGESSSIVRCRYFSYSSTAFSRAS